MAYHLTQPLILAQPLSIHYLSLNHAAWTHGNKIPISTSFPSSRLLDSTDRGVGGRSHCCGERERFNCHCLIWHIGDTDLACHGVFQPLPIDKVTPMCMDQPHDFNVRLVRGCICIEASSSCSDWLWRLNEASTSTIWGCLGCASFSQNKPSRIMVRSTM